MPDEVKPSLPTSGLSTEGILVFGGDWTARGLADTYGTHEIVGPHSGQGPVRVDLSGVQQMDSFGATAIADLIEDVRSPAQAMEILAGTPHHAELVTTLVEQDRTAQPVVPPRRLLPIETLGRGVIDAGQDSLDMAAVQGRIIVSLFNMATLRGPVRLAAIVNQFQDIVLRAIPIVALISLVVGIILTQQSIAQLRNFGAAIFVVDLSGILMLREVGILLAAIMVAGRSGSAITAEIGSMRMREELDALEVMGLDTYRAVILPRVMALIVGLPLLGLLGAIAGIVGSALAARISGGIAIDVFVSRLADVVDLHIILVGMIKAPFMAVAIAVIAVAEGLQVAGSTQSLGRHTTASVVKSIFVVIVIDGLFAVFFGAIGF